VKSQIVFLHISTTSYVRNVEYSTIKVSVSTRFSVFCVCGNHVTLNLKTIEIIVKIIFIYLSTFLQMSIQRTQLIVHCWSCYINYYVASHNTVCYNMSIDPDVEFISTAELVALTVHADVLSNCRTSRKYVTSKPRICKTIMYDVLHSWRICGFQF